MKTLNLSATLKLPIDVATMSILLLGKKGSGKSNTLVVLAEELDRAGVPTCILDPAGVHYGIRSSADGKSPGLPFYVCGGQHQDLPLFPENGALMADLFLDTGISMVLDTQPFSGREKARFVADFANRMYRRGPEKEQRGSARHLIVEEAHEYAPQNSEKGEEVMLGAMKRLYTMGRNYWYGFTFASQRAAALHKAITTQADILVALQIIGPQDRDAVDQFLKYHQDQAARQTILQRLPSLQTGTGEVYWPDKPLLAEVHFRYRSTLDTSSSSPLQHVPVNPVLASVDLKKLGERIEANVARAKADDPRELRTRVAALERTIHLKDQRIGELEEMAIQVRTVEKRVEMPVPVPYLPPSMERGLAKIREAGANLIQMAVDLGFEVSEIKKVPPLRTTVQVPPKSGKSATPVMPSFRISPQLEADSTINRPVNGTGLGVVGGAKQRILDTLAWLESVGLSPANRTQLAFMSGYTPNSGGFNNYLGSLRSADLIGYPSSGFVGLTDLGHAQANTPATPASTEELQLAIFSKLGAARSRILSALIHAYPNPMTREQLAETSGYTANSGGFNNYLGSMRSLGLIDYPDRGQVVATGVLFLDPVAVR